jgi:hypothetical protein
MTDKNPHEGWAVVTTRISGASFETRNIYLSEDEARRARMESLDTIGTLGIAHIIWED